MGIAKALANLFPLVVSTLALAFVVTSFVDRDWAHQSYYPIVDNIVTNEGEVQWQNPSFSKFRSPFIVCTYDLSDPEIQANGGRANASTTQVDIICVRYPIYGAGKTSCETRTRFESNFLVSDIIRDDRMCQQIHFSGNLLIAAIVFVVLGFTISLPLTYYSIIRTFATEEVREEEIAASENPTPEASVLAGKQDKSEQGGTTDRTVDLAVTARSSKGDWRRKLVPSGKDDRSERPGYLIASTTFAMIVCLAIAAFATFLSQFYGILGLIQSNPENGQFAYSVTPPPSAGDGGITYGPWVQGKALSTYMSLGWFFSAVGAGATGGIWAKYLHRQY